MYLEWIEVILGVGPQGRFGGTKYTKHGHTHHGRLDQRLVIPDRYRVTERCCSSPAASEPKGGPGKLRR